MDEAYKILPKKEHQYWDNFKKLHSEKIINFTRSILGEKVEKEHFITIYKRLTTMSGKNRRKGGINNYKMLKKYKWIK